MLIEPYVVIDVSFLHIQSNLSIANILYSKHLVIGDRISRNRPNLVKLPSQTFYIADSFIVDTHYSRH